MRSVLIVGGYGQFGARLSERLASLENCKVYVAGRDIEKAKALCEKLGGNLVPLCFDRNGDLPEQFSKLGISIVVDAAGPYQPVFETGYELPKFCAHTGIHYIDLSDSGEFTKGISALNKISIENSVAIISGASSVPALSSAVVNAAKDQFKTLTSIEGGISPGGKINIGLSVTKAVLSYLGKPLNVFRGGEWAQETGFSRQHRKTVSIPGEKPLRRKYGLCDAPDLLLFPETFPGVETVRFHGSTELGLIHNTLVVLAWLQKRGIVKNLEKHGSFFAWGGTQLGRFASERGCMYMEFKGIDANDQFTSQKWNLIAAEGDGPYIPIIAAEILVRRWLSEDPKPGARSAIGEITLEEFEAIFEKLSIKTNFDAPKTSNPLFKNSLGEQFAAVPDAVRRGHTVTSFKSMSGTVDVERGTNPVANLVATIFRFPKSMKNSPITVTMDVQDNKEIWTRKMGTSVFKSVFALTDRPGFATETFGPIKLGINLVLDEERLYYHVVSAQVFGIPLPKFLHPKSDTFEREDGDDFIFDVDIALPFFGRLVKYYGRVS